MAMVNTAVRVDNDGLIATLVIYAFPAERDAFPAFLTRFFVDDRKPFFTH